MKYILHLPTILLIYILLASTYSIINPLFESPDEVWHYEYIRWLVEGEGLARPEDVGHAPWHQEGSQPPLYYLSAALITLPISTENAEQVIRYNPHAAIGQPDSFGNKNVIIHGRSEAWPWKGVVLAAHVVRFFSILLGAVTITCTALIAHTIFPQQPIIGSFAALILALNPQFLFLNAAINNDNLVTAFCALILLFLVRLLGQYSAKEAYETQRRESQAPLSPNWRQLALLGLLIGAASLSKLSGIFIIAPAGLTLLFLAWQRRSFSILLRWSLISGVVALLVAGWWFVRNWMLFGDPLALEAMFAILPRRPEPPTVAELLARAEGVWRSIWAVFGWFNIVVPDWVYRGYSVLSLIGAGGFFAVYLTKIYQWWRLGHSRQNVLTHRSKELSNSENRNKDLGVQLIQMTLLAIWVLIIFLSLLRWAQMRYPQGRLLFPAISAASVILSFGLLYWLPTKLREYGALVLGGLLFVPALVAPWLWIAPSYAAPALATVESTIALAEVEEQPIFGERIQLLNYQLGQNRLFPGETLSLDLVWQATQPISADYSVFIHLVDEIDILQAQRDSFPGAGNAPTHDWAVGQPIEDTHQIGIPLTTPAPTRLRVDVGLYNHETNTRLVLGETDYWTIGFVEVETTHDDGAVLLPERINFDDQIALLEFEFDRRVLQPGETMKVRYLWEALDQPKGDYKVFTHLIFPPDATWAQMDSRPQRGASRTTDWEIGQQIEDEHELTLPENAPLGVYFIEIGLYDDDTHDRLKVNFSDQGIILGQVRVDRKED